MEIREIEQGLTKPGKSKGGLARALNKSAGTVTAILKGEREIKAREVPIIQKYLELTPVVPIIGSVGAGDEAHFYADGDPTGETAPAPQNSSSSVVAVEIRGESLGAGFRGWIAYYDDTRSPVTPDLYDRLCIVGLADGRVLAKIIKPARGKDRFHLLPNAGGEVINDAKVLWAARIIDLKPKP